jgi:GT2 family glycosyltransferase
LARPVSILAVIVLYKKKINECSALRSLRESLKHFDQNLDLRLKILVYENESSETEAGMSTENIVYHFSPCNGGLLAAYSFALAMATAEGFDWLLTLDQDSTVPPPFVSQVATIANEIFDRNEIAAIVPHVFSRKIFISPHVLKSGRSVRLPADFIGVPEGEVSAINSGTTWRACSLNEIGGFNPLFWLDYLDHWLFREVQRIGKVVYVAANLRIEHELSLLGRQSQPSPERYQNILAAESLFCDLYQSATDGLLLDATLLARSLNQLVRRRNRALSRVAWNCLRERIVSNRSARIDKRKRMSQQAKAAGELVQ